MSDLIEVVDLVKAFGYFPVLKKLNLSIERGEFVALLGPNGSGKSTLLRMLAGLSRPTSGVIRIGGWELPREAAAVRAQIGWVSHKSLIYENLTALENLRFFARIYDLPARDVDAHAMRLLERVGLKKRANDLARTFSRGMMQRLSIARALIHDPDVLLLDEPYTGLDQDAARTLDELLWHVQGDARTIIMVTHQLEKAALLANRVVILSHGAVGFDALMASVRDLPATYAEITQMVSAR